MPEGGRAALLRPTARAIGCAGSEARALPVAIEFGKALCCPHDVFSLSHVALPFPPSDGLYGYDPDPAENFGVKLGAIAARGETGALIVNLDALLRMMSNPFFPYMVDRIEECISENTPKTQSIVK